jgi:hypothetical protein
MHRLAVVPQSLLRKPFRVPGAYSVIEEIVEG